MLFVCENNQFATEVPFAYAAGNPERRRPRRGLRHARRRGGRQRRAGRLRGRRRGRRPRPRAAAGRRCSNAAPTAPGRTPRAWATSPTARARRSRSGRRAARSSGSRASTARRRHRPTTPSWTRSTPRSRPRSRRRQQFAERAPGPTRATATTHVYAAEPPHRDRRDRAAGRRARSPSCRPRSKRSPRRWPRTRRIFVLGEGIGKRGGNFSTTAGLYDLYGPERLCDTPICERGFVGLACGAAMTGTRPVVDFMFADFVLDARRRDRQPDRQDAVHEQRPAEDAGPAARLHRHRPLGGDAPLRQLLPDVRPLPRPARRRPVDALRRQGAAARTPCAATTRCCSSNIASCWRSRARCPRRTTRSSSARRAVVREGSDVTVVALAADGAAHAEGVRASWRSEGISVELIDPRTVVAAGHRRRSSQSVRKTGRLLIVGRGVRPVRHRRGDRGAGRRRGLRRPRRPDPPAATARSHADAVQPAAGEGRRARRGRDRPGDPRPAAE